MNKEFKSDVFSMLLEDPRNALSIYNALNGTDYDDPDDVTIFKLEGGVSLTVRNDASFIINSHLSLYEHQSSYNPNMPLRNLIYVTKMIEMLIKKESVHSSRLVEFPNPHFVVFYNGLENKPEKSILKLSDAFIHKGKDSELELIVTMYNINHGHNKALLSGCKILNEYSIFVDKARRYRAIMEAEDALERTIDECLKEDVLTELLTTRKEEVTKVSMLDLTYEHWMEVEKRYSKEEGFAEGHAAGHEEGLAKGLAEGRAAGIDEGIINGLLLAGLTPEQAAEKSGQPLERILEIQQEMNI